MEIKTCEQYVLAQLGNLERLNANLTSRLTILSNTIHEILAYLCPTLEGDKVKFNTVDAQEYIKKVDIINRVIANQPLEEEEEEEPVEE